MPLSVGSSPTDTINTFLSENGVFDIKDDNKLATVAGLVARIPYGEARTIEDVFREKKGTCTGKHLVLKACLDALGIESTNVFCTFRWTDQAIQFPLHLQEMLTKATWNHGHNFLKVLNYEGKYIEVDVSINPGLERYGFRTFSKEWDGLRSTPLAFDKIIKKWEGGDIAAEKEKLENSLSPELREYRKMFVSEFFKWIREVNRKDASR